VTRNDEAAASCWLDSGCCACPCALLGCAVPLPFGMAGAGRTAPDSSELQKLWELGYVLLLDTNTALHL